MVELGGSGFGREDPQLNMSEPGWEGKDLPSTARKLGRVMDGSGLVG